MEWQFIVAMAVAIPLILFPAAFIWYLNIGGLIQAWQERKVKTVEKTGATVKVQ
jgi:hypothetical protein